MSAAPTVFVVDDDAAVRDGLALLLDTAGLAVETYDSAAAFLAVCSPGRAGCLILDVRMPEMGGPELQAELNRRGIDLPIIFLTAHGDIPTTVQAMKAGALDFLTKPIASEQLLGAIEQAMANHESLRGAKQRLNALRTQLETLTPREHQVFELVVQGKINKQIAQRLGTTERTIKAHRHKVMEKMGIQSLAELVSIAERLGVLRRLADEGRPG
jgi:RNA polymerase sigma factor (sigma-70 family)